MLRTLVERHGAGNWSAPASAGSSWFPPTQLTPTDAVTRSDKAERCALAMKSKVRGPGARIPSVQNSPPGNRDQPREAVALNRAANVQSPTVRSAGALRFRWYVLRDMDAGSDGSGRSDSDSDGCGPALPHASRC